MGQGLYPSPPDSFSMVAPQPHGIKLSRSSTWLCAPIGGCPCVGDTPLFWGLCSCRGTPIFWGAVPSSTQLFRQRAGFVRSPVPLGTGLECKGRGPPDPIPTP